MAYQSRRQHYGSSFEPAKRYPTHYIYIDLPDSVKVDLDKVKETLREEADRLGLDEISKEKANHLTLAVFDLSDELKCSTQSRIDSMTSDILTEIMDEQPDFKIELGGLGHFNNRVLFIEVKRSPDLSNLRSKVIDTFERHRIPFTDKKPFNPHITLYKGAFGVRPKGKIPKDYLSTIELPEFISVPVDGIYIGEVSKRS